MPFFKTLRFRVSLFFITIVFLLEIILLNFNFYAINTVHDQVSQSYRNLLPSIVGKMDDSLDEVRNYLIRTINSDGDSVDFVNFNTCPKDSFDYSYSMTNIFRMLVKDSNFFDMTVGSLFVYSLHNDELISYSPNASESPRDYTGIKQKIKECERKGTAVNTYSQWEINMQDGKPELICFIGNSAGCYVGSTIDMEKLLKQDQSNDNLQNGAVIMTKGKNILLSTNIKIPNKAIISEVSQKTGSQTIVLPNSGNRYLVITQAAQNADIIYVQILNEKTLTDNLSIFQALIILLPLGLLVILLLYFVFIRNALLKPMGQLVNGMRHFGQGNLEVQLDEKGPEEFRIVVRTFNSMVSQINKLKIDIYEGKLNEKNADLKAANANLKAANAELETKKAELRSMQWQINPHFFANSLNIIYNLAALNNMKAVQKMSICLSNYFRYLLHAGNSMTELRYEMDFIRNYLDIQKLRFTSRLDFEISVPEKYMCQQLPPLLIQPLVENCIVHGFKAHGQPLILKIKVEPDKISPEKAYVISIIDNGIGFSDDDLRKFEEQSDNAFEDKKHIGIWNVNYRLKMTFGESYKLLLCNGFDGGAIVSVYLPINTVAP